MKLKGISVTEMDDSYLIEVEAGENWQSFVEYTLNNDIYGLENLALIPGSVGACPVQNIGAYGVEIETFIENVKYFDLKDGEIKVLSNSECNFSYRNSIFKKELKTNAVITSVCFKLPKEWKPVVTYGELARLKEITPTTIFKKVIETRRSKLPDPDVIGNAGSFFKNPIISNDRLKLLLNDYPDMPTYPWSETESKVAAGWLIDKAGLKGKEIEGSAVHEKQALVIINKSGDASCQSLVELISLVQDRVSDRFSIDLEPEVRIFGSTGEAQFSKFTGRNSG